MNSTTSPPTWLDQIEYPFEHQYMELDAGTMHYVDEGEGEVILFVHGTPAWSFLYRDFIREFSGEYRAIAVDHIGFGLSEKQQDLAGRPEDHSHNLSEFIQKLDLKNITLVVHDFGGPIGLAAGMEHEERIRRVILFNSWLWESASNKSVQKIDRLIRSFLGRFLYLRLNISPKVLLRQGFSDRKKLTKKIHRQYIRPFPDKASRWGLYRIAQSLVGSSEWYQKQWERLSLLEDRPWLILWGMKDSFITPDFLDNWKTRLPDSDVVTFDCGHFVQEERVEEAIGMIRKFLEGPA